MFQSFNPLPRVPWIAVCLCLLTTFAFADEPQSSSDHEVKEKEQAKTVSLDGVFESKNAKELVIKNEHLKSLEIERLADHGTTVSKGQSLFWFATKDLDKKVKEAEIELRLAGLTMKDDEFAYKQFIATQELDRAAAEQARANAKQDYDNFVKIDRDRQRLSAKFNVKSSQAALDNAAEELKQLEQMYKEDDLTEESEEIVLKRAKQSVEFAQHRLDGTKISSTRTLEQSIPRSEISEDDKLARAEAAYRKSIHSLQTARARQDIEIARKREKFTEQQEKLAEMQQERKRVVLKSPIKGILLYGTLNRGKLAEQPSTLKKGSSVAADQVIATVVDPSQIQVRVTLNEDQLRSVKAGDSCDIYAKAFPDHKFSGKVQSVGAVAFAAGKYDCVVSIRRNKKAPKILPTMTCKLEFAAQSNDK